MTNSKYAVTVNGRIEAIYDHYEDACDKAGTIDRAESYSGISRADEPRESPRVVEITDTRRVGDRIA